MQEMLLIDNFYVSIMVDTKRRQCVLELRYIIMRDTIPVNAWWRARQDPASLPVDLSILFLARSWKNLFRLLLNAFASALPTTSREGERSRVKFLPVFDKDIFI